MAKEINLKEIFNIMKKRYWVIIATTIIVTLAGFFYSTLFNPSPLYQSGTRIVIGADANNMSTLMVMIKDPSILEKVSHQLNAQRSPNALDNEIIATNIDSSQVVSIAVTDSNPVVAAEIANLTASTFKSEAENILNFSKVQLLSPAKVIPVPINPDNNNKILYALFVGIVAGVGLVFLLNSLDNSIQSEQGLEKILEVTSLGSISKMNRKNIIKRRTFRNQPKDIKELSPFRNRGTIKKGRVAYKSAEKTSKGNELSYKATETAQRINH